ncbi:Leucine zipper with capping helix domain [Dillenia turbinata]|uniref:Leucine zipper with capping helix domain n=1 Tax=Dillenia turbinata TaxID=194707 RepID=A0AAN8VDI2_9MAGN
MYVEIKTLQSNLSVQQIHDKEAKLRAEVSRGDGEKLEKLREGVTLVRPEDRTLVEQLFVDRISQWRKRKRMFTDMWDAIIENSPKDLKEFKEELGLEYDDVGENLLSFADMMPDSKKRSRGQ